MFVFVLLINHLLYFKIKYRYLDTNDDHVELRVYSDVGWCHHIINSSGVKMNLTHEARDAVQVGVYGSFIKSPRAPLSQYKPRMPQQVRHSSGVTLSRTAALRSARWSMLRRASGLQLVALLLLLSRSSSAVHNDATESLDTQPVHDTQDEAANDNTNQARNGGRRPADAVRNGESKRLRMTRTR